MPPVIIDISVPVFSGMAFYPGDPGAEITTNRSIAQGDVANITKLCLGSHTGTHIDAPYHFKDDGETVDRLSLETLMGPAFVMDLGDIENTISRSDLETAGLEGVKRLLLKTRNSKLWGLSGFEEEYVSLAGDAADYLVEAGVDLVGIDYLSVERFKSDTFHVHHKLLGAGVILLEGINLEAVRPGIYELICLPLKIRDGDGAPARAVLIKN
ncbi:MAG: cyclase family protein [Thermoleophilia bacterium]|jgi:arylformamidase